MIMIEKFWTLPNAITLFRLLFGAPITILLYKNGIELTWAVFLFLALTDRLDGYLARKFNMVSSWGIKLDPLADQFLVLPVLWAFYLDGYIALFPPALLTIREFLMVLLRIFAKRDIPAHALGRYKVTAEYIGIALLLVGGEWFVWGLLMFFPILFLAIISFFKYIYDFYKQSR